MGRFKGPSFPEGAPDNFNPEAPFADPVALLEYREYVVREKAIKVETAKVMTVSLWFNVDVPLICCSALVSVLSLEPSCFGVSNQILKEKVRACYLREGVNHMSKCREVS